MTTAVERRGPRELGHHGLQGWRGRVADAVAPRVANVTPAREDDVRAAIGLAFIALAGWYLAKTFVDFARSR
jgi:hypothetical protein